MYRILCNVCGHSSHQSESHVSQYQHAATRNYQELINWYSTSNNDDDSRYEWRVMDSFEVCVVYGDDIDISPDILATAPVSSRWAPDWDWEEVLKAQLLSCISSCTS